MNNTSCTREDLRGYVPRSQDFTVDTLGIAQDYVDSADFDPHDVDEYHCQRCLGYWPVGQRWSEVARLQAWRQAIHHLGGHDEDAA